MSRKLQAAVVTISDTRQLDTDIAGNRLVELLTSFGAEIAVRQVIDDDLFRIRELLAGIASRGDVDLILTTGGTGFGPRDNTPEATRAVIDREAPGLAEAMRRETSARTPLAMLSRGIAGIRDKTLVINLPGSPKAVEECFEVIRPVLRHAVDLISGKTGH